MEKETLNGNLVALQRKQISHAVVTLYTNRSFEFCGDNGSKKLTEGLVICQKHQIAVRKQIFGKSECPVCREEPFSTVEALVHAIGVERVNFEIEGMKLSEKIAETDPETRISKLRIFFARVALENGACFYARWQIGSRDRYELVLTPEKAPFWRNGVRTNPTMLTRAIAHLADQYPRERGALGFEIPIMEFEKLDWRKTADDGEEYHFVSYDVGATFSVEKI